MQERKETVEVQLENPHVDSVQISIIPSACFRIGLPKFLSQYQVDEHGSENSTEHEILTAEAHVQCHHFFVIFVVGSEALRQISLRVLLLDLSIIFTSWLHICLCNFTGIALQAVFLIPIRVIAVFHWLNPSGRTTALG